MSASGLLKDIGGVPVLEKDGMPFLLAVSGGIDSMCMADQFFRQGRSFAIAHCNFHLRGEDSNADEALVSRWASERGILFHKTDFDTVSYAEENGLSIEMAARELRYKWFATLCSEFGYKYLSVAHNANDNAETLFLNLLRGTGLRGLSGMKEISPLQYSETGACIIRPLLSVTRKQIEGYVMANNVPYRDDRTNSEVEYKRNRIRHRIFPEMETMNPSFVKTVSREMSFFAQVSDIADRYYTDNIGSLVSDDKLDVAKLKCLTQWQYILYRYLDVFGFNSPVVSDIVKLIEDAGTFSGKTFSSPTHILLTGSDFIIVRPKVESMKADSVKGEDGPMEINAPGEYGFNSVGFSVDVVDRSRIPSLRQPEGTLLFDADVAGFPLFVDRWKAGDWFRPLGLKGKKKVSDYFTDRKYDLFRKQASVVLLTSGEITAPEPRHISAVLCERIDDACKITERTEKVLIIRKFSLI